MGRRAKREQRKAERRAAEEAEAARIAEQNASYFATWRAEILAQTCPTCGRRAVAQYFYGLPHFTPELNALLDDDLVVLGGCDYGPDEPLWVCRSCKRTWGRADDLVQLIRVRRSLQHPA
ncbi:hypothetical protein R5W24_005759 [Gemmata sp. JC717]|uniref:hypothetical protein n=1 Tax=Gemmata algarum TaxID=2975278 RepID=UPI0021BBB08E|nr:hypothetical protein [Gemmata algarum]MDY3556592.1 hypothetical protein [Gemmata algarum]